MCEPKRWAILRQFGVAFCGWRQTALHHMRLVKTETAWREIANGPTFPAFELILLAMRQRALTAKSSCSKHFARVVARLAVGGIKPADAPVKSPGNRDVEGLGK